MEKKDLTVSSLVMMIFIGVFGFGNIANNFKETGLLSVTMLIIGVLFFFIPLCLIMAEFGAYAKDRASGIYSWIEIGLGDKVAYFAIWAYFVASIFYLPTLATRVPTYMSYAIYGSSNISGFQMILFSSIALVIALLIGLKYEKAIAIISKYVGYISLGTVIVFLLAGIYVYLTGKSATLATAKDFSLDLTTKESSAKTLGNFAWILFAFGGGEIVGPYVNRVKNPEKDFIRGLLLSSFLIGILYILGIFAIASFATKESFEQISLVDAVLVGFKFMGDKLGIGIWFLQLMGVIYTVITIVALILWSTSLASGVFSEAPKGTFPQWLTKREGEKGILKNALIFQTVLTFLFLAITTFGGKQAGEIYYKIYDMSTMAMIVPYICLAISYISFRLKGYNSSFKVSKNNIVAVSIGVLVLLMTLIAFIFAGYDYSIPIPSQKDKIMLYYGGLLMFMSIGIIMKLLNREKREV